MIQCEDGGGSEVGFALPGSFVRVSASSYSDRCWRRTLTLAALLDRPPDSAPLLVRLTPSEGIEFTQFELYFGQKRRQEADGTFSFILFVPQIC